MNKNLNEYRIYCNTESNYTYTYSDTVPISCPNNGTHSIDPTKTVVVGRTNQNVFPLTSFDELRVAERTGIIELKSVFGKSTLRDIYIEEGTATITNNLGDSEYRLAVSGANDVAWLKSAERGRYVAGLQGEVGIACRLGQALVGNQTLKIGLFDDDNGFYYKYSSSNVETILFRDGVETAFPRSQWNIDKFDGSGPSKYVLDSFDGIIYTIRFTWYGYGNIEYRLNVTNSELKQASWLGHIYNPYSETSVKTPNLNISVKLENNGTAASGLAFVAGRQYSLLGKYEPITRVNAFYRTGIAVTNGAFTFVGAIRRKLGYAGNPIKAFAADILSTENVILQFRTQSTLTNPVWSTPNDTNSSDTAVECDFTSVIGTFTGGGKPIWTGIVAGGTNRTSGSARLDVDYDLAEYDNLVILLRGTTSNTTASVAFRWTEGW
jgi:hypothetical protein